MKTAIALIDISPRMNAKKIFAPKGATIQVIQEYAGFDGLFSLCEYNGERFFTQNVNLKFNI